MATTKSTGFKLSVMTLAIMNITAVVRGISTSYRKQNFRLKLSILPMMLLYVM